MEQVLGTSVDGYVPEAFRERAHQAMRAAIDTKSVQQYSTVGQTSANEVGHYLTRVSPMIEDGEVTSLVMIATDVTMLEEQRLQLQVALDASELGIWTHDPVAGRGSWDAQSRRIFGVKEDVPAPDLPTVLEKLIHPDDRQVVAEALARAEETGRYGPISHRIVREQGDVRWVNATGLAIRNHEGEVVNIVGSVQDVTERRTLEERLLEAQKLESIGRLAGGVAHDFNNMLTAVLGNIEFARDASTIEEVRPLLDSIAVTAERSAALTAQLLAFARRQVIEPRVFDPNDLIRRIETVFKRAIGEHVQVVLSLEARGRLRADESQIEQVVMNLVTNARDAMSTGGALTIETLDVELDDEYASTHPDVASGDYVMIAVSDTGPGIPQEALPYVFEPFFTTRTSGTGLGLATCYGIVKQSGGHLSVYSELGRGSTFKIYLPRTEEVAPQSETKAPSPGPGRGGRVLLVEDEAPVREVIDKALSRHGYVVHAVGAAEEALEVATGNADFQLLVTDVVLPGMGGRALSERLTQRYPNLRVLFISGYTENAIVHGGVLDPGIHFLQKPFVPADLLNAVRRILDEARTTNH
jgi:signal transduction histidine kinase/ActR/RegA family two-component response regulator